MEMILLVAVEREEDSFERLSLFLRIICTYRCIIPHMAGIEPYLYNIWWIMGDL